jgi:dihydrofolate synthase/folylpolyglutamate synthase
MSGLVPLDYLFSLEQHGIKLGLENIRTLCAALGHPEKTFKSIIVAGTNGKGSVAAIIETALRADNVKTGRYTSPHLVRLEERFCVSGKQITHSILSDLARELKEVINNLQQSGQLQAPPTFFEVTTAIAFTWFARSDVEVAVLEVGMGGQFDATNVVTPIGAVITEVNLDHQQFLGQTLSKIAFEKSGVIKPGIVVVTTETKPPVLEVFRRICLERAARLIECQKQVTTDVKIQNHSTELKLTTPRATYGPLKLSLRGRHQVQNACSAVRLLEELNGILPISSTAIKTALTNTCWPGRLQLLQAGPQRHVLLDAAHNPAAASALASYLAEMYPQKLPLVFAASRDKDITGIIRVLIPHITKVICVQLKTTRTWSSTALNASIVANYPSIASTTSDSPQAALEAAWLEQEIAVAAGSVYLAGEITHLLDPSANAVEGRPR